MWNTDPELRMIARDYSNSYLPAISQFINKKYTDE